MDCNDRLHKLSFKYIKACIKTVQPLITFFCLKPLDVKSFKLFLMVFTSDLFHNNDEETKKNIELRKLKDNSFIRNVNFNV